MISYQSSARQREAILNGEVDAAITSLGDFAPILSSGDAVGVVEFSTVRNAGYPTVPTSKELGLSDSLLSGSFLTLAVPAGTPADVVEKLAKAYGVATTSKEFADWAATVGVTPDFKSGAELKTFIDGKIAGETKALQALKDAGVIKYADFLRFIALIVGNHKSTAWSVHAVALETDCISYGVTTPYENP